MKKFPQDFEERSGIWVAKGAADNIAYSDGKAAEDYLLETIENAHDLSSTSEELQKSARDWSSRYHLSATRGSLFRGLSMRSGSRILELGSGCGAITRYLGEQDVKVTAVEGSLDRARITRARCRELENVEVVSGNFDDLSFEHRFDIVTLIGVLEYSHLFCRAGEADPFSYVLKAAWEHLEDDGVLVIAIENKLGIKYLAGCGEDHLGAQFVGVEGYPDDEGARTFGKQELLELVEQCGFVDHELLLPFPDYKLPTTLINAKSCSAKDAKKYNVVDWCRQNYEDYVNPRAHIFQEHLALDTMAANGLFADFSNSFLLVASKKPLDQSAPILPVDWHAKKINVTRASTFQTVTTLKDGDNGSVVTKQGMVERSSRSNANFSLVMEDQAAYVENGRSLSLEFLRAIRGTRSPKIKYQNAVASWVEFLQSHAEQMASGPVLPPKFLDCIPDNIIRDESGSLNYIDTEWHWKEPVALEWVVFRGLFVFWSYYKRWIEKTIVTGSYSFKGFVDISLEKSNVNLSVEQLEVVSALENTFESSVFGNEMGGYFKNLLHQSFNGQDGKTAKTTDEVYREWISLHALQEIDGQLFAERMMLKWAQRPVFHLFVFLLPDEELQLANTLDSLAGQMYPDWRLTVISDDPAPDMLWQAMDELNWVRAEDGANPYDLLSMEISVSTADWVAFIEPGARFAPQALVQFGDYVNLHPEWNLIYPDEDIMSDAGLRSDPKFKPDFNLDLLRSSPYTGNFCVTRREALLEIGGVLPFPGAENYDLVFRIFDQFGALAIGHVADVLYHAPANSTRSYPAHLGQVIVENHLERNMIAAQVTSGLLKNTTRVKYLYDSEPLVSIIIPTKDKLEFLKPCLDTLVDNTDYSNYEILLVDNQSEDPDTLSFYSMLSSRYSRQIRVISYPQVFNFSAMCNLGVEESSGDYVLFLNNDTEVLHPEWLSRMMSYVQRTDIGAVGARLVYPEIGKIQHAGVVLGIDEVAHHPYINTATIKDTGYMGRLQLDQNYSAVTAACLLVGKADFLSVQGMDATEFTVSYNDIDLCLKLSKSGLRNLWTPYATLVHHGNISQKSANKDVGAHARAHERFQKERAGMLAKWLPELASDPAYNPNLSLVSEEFDIEINMPRNWDVNFKDRLHILGIPIQGGSGDYRVIQPFEALSKSGLAQCEHYRLGSTIKRQISISEIERMQPDVVVVQAAIDDMQLKLLPQIKQYKADVFRVFTLDDLLTGVPEKSSFYRYSRKTFPDVRPRLRKALANCNRMIVTTQVLAEACTDLIDDIRVIPNRLPRDKWLSLQSLRGQGDKPRVGWVGAQQHKGDLEIIIDVVKETAKEIDWIFMGMCPDVLRPLIKEYHSFVAIDEYPAKMASLNLDLAVAPLEIHSFNEAKSNLRLLEYGAMGWPVVCTDITPYQSYDAPVTRVPNTTEAWLNAIKNLVADPQLAEQAGAELKQWVIDGFILEDHLDEWLDAMTPPGVDMSETRTLAAIAG